MKYLSADILFKEESAASQFFAAIHPHLQEDGYLLKQSLARVLAVPPVCAFEFSIDVCKQYRNVINLEFYGGTRDEYEDIISAFFAAGAYLLKLRVRADEYHETERYAAGKRVKKLKEFDKEYDKLLIADVNLEFTRAISKSAFSKAVALLTQIDKSRVKLDDEHLRTLFIDTESEALVLAMIAQGFFPENLLVAGEVRLFALAANMGSSAVLQAFFELGFNPYLADNDGNDVLHAVLYCQHAGGIAAAEYVATQCAADLDPIGAQGSPLWYAFQEQLNMAGARHFRQHGATSIAPAGFYDELTHEDIIAEAASHADLATLQTHFTPADHAIAVRKAIYSEALEVLQWLDNQQKIDWLAVVETDRFDSFLQREVRLYETPFMFNSGDNADFDFYTMIIDAVAHDKAALDVIAVYLAGYNGSSHLLRKLGSLGARFVPAAIDHGDPEYPLFKAALGGHLNNLATLLEMGAARPEGDGETLGEFALRGMGKHKIAQAKDLFARYGV
ncbi:hypothetical protein ACO0LL_21600 [Undibacterium sp. TC4M20W]|uniref:hypothetical protein n=1 Tax=Undibacterium sp. TC4M20W TaxID=3413052 RepID=UPI003BF2B17D